MALDFDLAQIESIYDSLNSRIRADLQADYDCKKINGATFADTWAKLMSTVVNSSIQAAISLATKETPTDILVKLEQIEVMKQDIKNKKASESLTIRQEKGFDDNLRQKLYESQMNAWALMFSSGLLENKPNHINDGEVSALAKSIKDSITTGAGENPLGNWTQEISATAYDGSSTTISWGSVANATLYTLYVDSTLGAISGYPKTVNGNGTEVVTLTPPEPGASERYTFKIIASDATGKYYRTSSYNLTISTPAG